ncbi:MAG TPA: UdgX family uracil-DNA binding protein [Telluria sp.]|nr:UdgX family uracil-DNA binding protein [Telluria sp.]
MDSFAAWRVAARELLACDIAPQAVHWSAGDALSSSAPPQSARADNGSGQFENKRKNAQPPLHLPRSLMGMLYSAACCRVPDRWGFLYRIVWRWQRGERRVLSVADGDGARLHAMVTAVRREEHEMHATIRFRERPERAGAPRFVAWCTPQHDVLPQLARHFVSRIGRVSWMIATPEASVLWDGAVLHDTGPLVPCTAGLGDAGAAPWVAYYRGAAQQAAVRNGAPRGAAGHDSPQDERPATLDQCRRCELWRNATQPVGGAGPKRARLMLVGEQPGDQEDLAGQPFVGPAGKLLDRALEQAGIDRRAVYLTNAVKHFKWEPRGKRRMHKTPAQREIEACGYWLDKELAAVRPEVIVALGSTALKAVLGTGHVTLKDTIGQPLHHGGRWVVTVYHPSYVLRVPDAAAKEQAFGVMVEGFRLAQQLLTQAPPPG